MGGDHTEGNRPIFDPPVKLLLCTAPDGEADWPFQDPSIRWHRCHSTPDCLASIRRNATDAVIIVCQKEPWSTIQLLLETKPAAGERKIGLFAWAREGDDVEPYYRAGAMDVFEGARLDRSHVLRLWSRLEALRSPQQVAERMLRYQDLLLDPENYRVWRGGRSIPLTSQQLRLLKVMIKQPHHVFTRSDLQEFWETQDLNPTNLRTCFTRLRRVLNQAGSIDLVHNVHGVGYALDRHAAPKREPAGEAR